MQPVFTLPSPERECGRNEAFSCAGPCGAARTAAGGYSVVAVTWEEHTNGYPAQSSRVPPGYSQDDLAARMEVERSTILRWEAARSTPQPWIRPTLAATLDITANELETLLRKGDSGIDSLDSVGVDRAARCAETVEVRNIKRALGPVSDAGLGRWGLRGV